MDLIISFHIILILFFAGIIISLIFVSTTTTTSSSTAKETIPDNNILDDPTKPSLNRRIANIPAMPISFSIPESKIINFIPEKTRDCGTVIPGKLETYIFQDENSYYKDYQSAYYGVTKMKGGWDCLRHYEILANGCMPYFINLQNCPKKTMVHFPKELVLEAMQLPGVTIDKDDIVHIDHTIFDERKYNELLKAAMKHTRDHIVNSKMAEYVLNTTKKYQKTTDPSNFKVLFLSSAPHVDYLRCTLLSGFKMLLGKNVDEYVHAPHIYSDYTGETLKLYGRGFTYSKTVPAELKSTPTESEIANNINTKIYDIIIMYLHAAIPMEDLVVQNYAPDDILYICGGDLFSDNVLTHCEVEHQKSHKFLDYTFFQREILDP